MMLIGAIGLAAATGFAGKSEPKPPKLTLAFEARIMLGSPIEQGTIDVKCKRLIPITGGIVKGPKLNGVILSGGGDWQSIHPDGLTEIFACYSIKADDGTVFANTNPGVRMASPDIAARLAGGEDVDSSFYYFRTTPCSRYGTARMDGYVAKCL